MPERILVHPARYHDSAFLMRLSQRLAEGAGLEEAVVVMGTELNRELLAGVGFHSPELEATGPMDLVIALRAALPAALDRAEAECERLLSEAAAPPAPGTAARPASLREALASYPQADLVSVAVPGEYAAHVAMAALRAGRHVFLFSNNVPLPQEIALKREARERGLLVMGPDCGTAILGGVGLGFANRVRRGPVGLVGASGTGLQEVSSLLHQLGSGVSQAIGTGSRDLTAEVGATMTEAGLRLLAADPDTRVIGLVAKHPAEQVATRLHGLLASLEKPVVVRYLGQAARPDRDGVRYAGSLEEAACAAASLAAAPRDRLVEPACPLEDDVRALAGRDPGSAGRLVGLFGGGSLASEAALVLRGRGLEVHEPDAPLPARGPLPGQAHLVVDTGEDFYTRGKPHPMVDQTVRCGLIRSLGADPGVGVLLLDLVLGDGAHPDPAVELAAAVSATRAARGHAPLTVIASVTGTELDPQDANRQRALLTAAGVHCQPSAWRAAAVAAGLVAGAEGRAS
jgi:FdrA protein